MERWESSLRLITLDEIYLATKMMLTHTLFFGDTTIHIKNKNGSFHQDGLRELKMTDKEIIRKAYFALAGYRSPSLTKKQQEKELARCWYLLADAVHGTAEGEKQDDQ